MSTWLADRAAISLTLSPESECFGVLVLSAGIFFNKNVGRFRKGEQGKNR